MIEMNLKEKKTSEVTSKILNPEIFSFKCSITIFFFRVLFLDLKAFLTQIELR